MSRLEHRFPPPLLCVTLACAMWLVARVTPVLNVGALPRMALATALSSIGLVGVLGIAEFRKSKTTIDPVRIANASALVTSGVFRITRNPMYVGLTALLLAWGVVLDAPATLAFPFVFAAFLNRFQIIPEERAMTNRFGEAYLVYCRRVRRWL